MRTKILITGGAGFIGSNFTQLTTLKHPDDEVVVLDKLTYAGNRENIEELIHAKRVRFIEGDIADNNFIADLFQNEGFTHVVNCAAETHVDRSIIEPAIFVMTNIVGTHNLLEAARQNNVHRFLQISTDEVYGDLGDNSIDYFTENTPLSPNSPYAASKASADLLVQSYVQTYDFPAVITRCSNNYGPYQFPEKLIPFFFKLAQQDKPLPLYGDGKNVRDWLFVEDHCEAIDLVLHKAKPGSIYNIGGNSEKQNIQIAELILAFLGKPKSLVASVTDRLGHDRRYAIDASKIKRELGWEPKTSFKDGIKKTFEWYVAHEVWGKRILERNAIDEAGSHLKKRPETASKTHHTTH